METVFISYCRSDRNAIDHILSELQSFDLRHWVDDSDILPTMEFNERILDGLTKSQWFLLVMTPRSAVSEYVKDELHWALTNRNGRIIPVMLEQCDPAAFHLRMLRIQYVDLTPANKNASVQLQRTLQLLVAAREGESLPLNNRNVETNLELVSLLLTFIPREHQKHLRNLLPQELDPQTYIGRRSTRHELRDLCTWGLVKRRPNESIGDQVQDDRRFLIGDVVELTELGKQLAVHVS